MGLQTSVTVNEPHVIVFGTHEFTKDWTRKTVPNRESGWKIAHELSDKGLYVRGVYPVKKEMI